MTREVSGPWRATIRVRAEVPAAADRLMRSLGPEAKHEVPRSRARVKTPDPETVEIRIEAFETGALRAALNTYLGWAHLAAGTERAAHAVAQRPPAATR